jgi:hypothetical protein
MFDLRQEHVGSLLLFAASLLPDSRDVRSTLGLSFALDELRLKVNHSIAKVAIEKFKDQIPNYSDTPLHERVARNMKHGRALKRASARLSTAGALGLPGLWTPAVGVHHRGMHHHAQVGSPAQAMEVGNTQSIHHEKLQELVRDVLREELKNHKKEMAAKQDVFEQKLDAMLGTTGGPVGGTKEGGERVATTKRSLGVAVRVAAGAAVWKEKALGDGGFEDAEEG